MAQGTKSSPTWPASNRRNVIGAVIGIVVIGLALLAILFFGINDLLVDRLWFASQHQLPVWDLRTFGRILLWIPISVLAFVLLTLSVWLAVSTAGEAAPPVTRIRTPLRGTNGPRGYQAPGAEAVAEEVLRTLDDFARDVAPRTLGLHPDRGRARARAAHRPGHQRRAGRPCCCTWTRRRAPRWARPRPPRARARRPR